MDYPDVGGFEVGEGSVGRKVGEDVLKVGARLKKDECVSCLGLGLGVLFGFAEDVEYSDSVDRGEVLAAY